MGSLPEQNEMTTSTHQSAITVSTGPAGRAMAEPMSKDMLDLMQAYLNFERQSAADYFAAAIWFAERELVGFAEHLRDEAKQEQEHAAKFADYLISRGQRPVLDTVETPRQQWTDVEQVITSVFRMEADVTASALQLYSTAEKDMDRRTTVFLELRQGKCASKQKHIGEDRPLKIGDKRMTYNERQLRRE